MAKPVVVKASVRAKSHTLVKPTNGSRTVLSGGMTGRFDQQANIA
jgi:hypothetical protein